MAWKKMTAAQYQLMEIDCDEVWWTDDNGYSHEIWDCGLDRPDGMIELTIAAGDVFVPAETLLKYR